MKAYEAHELFRKCETWLERISYKPGWEFKLIHPKQYTYEFLITRFELDATDLDRKLSLWSSQQLSEEEFSWGEEHWFIVIKHLIIETEMHEMAEWFKIDGVLDVDPHKERLQLDVAPLLRRPA